MVVNITMPVEQLCQDYRQRCSQLQAEAENVEFEYTSYKNKHE